MKVKSSIVAPDKLLHIDLYISMDEAKEIIGVLDTTQNSPHERIWKPCLDLQVAMAAAYSRALDTENHR